MKGFIFRNGKGLLRAAALVVLYALGCVLQGRRRHSSKLLPSKGSLLGLQFGILVHVEGAAALILLAGVGDCVLYLLIEI